MISKTWARPTTTDCHGRRFVRLVPVIAVGASLIASAPAAAATVSADYGKGVLSVQAAPGSTDVISVSAVNGELRIGTSTKGSSLSLVELGSTGLCSLVDTSHLRCPKAGISRVAVDLGSGADQINLSGVSLPATVTGAGPGAKKVTLGPGDDQVSLLDGVADQIDCGDGVDSVVVDQQDTLNDCEHVDVSTSVSTPVTDVSTGPSASTDPTTDGTGGDQGTAGSGNSLTAPIGIVLPAHPIEFPAPNAAVVHVGCAETQTGGCQGDVILELPAQARRPHSTKRVVAARGHFVAQQHHRIGKSHFKLAAGQSADVPVHITLRGHFIQASKRRHPRQGVLKVVVRDSAGKVVGVDTRVVTLKLSNKWSRIHRHGN